VYDAEDAPAPDQLRLAASRFASESGLDCLQARLTVRNSGDSWLSNLFAVEYAVLFDLINPGLCALDMPIALGGTSNHFRVASLLGAGRWDEWNVAEDADLGIRLARSGYRVGSLSSDTSEEAPYELGNWFRQRTRWQKGWMRLVKSRVKRQEMQVLPRITTVGYTPRRNAVATNGRSRRGEEASLPRATRIHRGSSSADRRRRARLSS